ncbi:LysR family transcriptional regulator [Telmatospirillum sp. J64-1]|uniref:LysR family transcriptional regulator n=1 Tax=Telmatospirillum sp. J64-1 TaxID=2502183 RepID=UPI00115CEBAF|nr:LysR family transcriptional regulator [Telmatospirillum sp. J64-1]
MSIRRLKTLIAVAEAGTFAAAAEVVHVSQAAVSMQMKSLEEELRTTLFDRSKRPPELNQTGQALIPKARDIIQAYDRLVQSMSGKDVFSGELVLGVVPTCVPGLAPLAMVRLRDAYPDLRIRIIPGLSADLMPQLERGFLDTAIISEPPRTIGHLYWRQLAEEPLVVLAAREVQGDDPLELLKTRPFIRFNRQAWVGRQIDEMLQRNGIRVQENMELDSLEAIETMVFHNLGVSVVPRRCVPPPVSLPIWQLPLNTHAKPRVLGLVWRQDSPKQRLIEVVYDSMAELVEEAELRRSGAGEALPAL